MSWIAVGVLGGALIGAVGSNMAASTQANAAENAAGIQQGMFNQVMGNEQPFISAGQSALNPLLYGLGIGPQTTATGPPTGAGYGGRGGGNAPGISRLPATAQPPGIGYGSLNAPFTTDTFKTMSPAYQFAKQQGMQGVLNQDATAGSALAPTALKDLISFNSQFANQSFNNAFNQYQTQQQNIFNRLQTLAGLGMQAGSGGTTGAPSFAQSIGQQVANVGTAQAGGIVGGTNSLTGALPWLYANNSGMLGGGGGGPNAADILGGNSTNIGGGP